MISRPVLVISLAALLAIVALDAGAQSAPPPSSPSAVVIPPNKCVKPEYPGKLATSQRFAAFNKDFTAYGACIQKYVDDTKLIINAAAAAGNGAVEEFNKVAADIKAQDEAAKN
jgi:hypothetical protein